jgi:hypothetical protein
MRLLIVRRHHAIYVSFISNRAIPGITVGVFATFIGIGSAFVTLVPFFNPKKFQQVHLLFIPAFIFAVWYVRHLWRKGVSVDTASYVMEMPPRLLAMILGGCLLSGVIIGGLLAYAGLD